MNTSSRDLILLYHTILIGASPLIPLPFVDEWIVTYFWKHMLGEIASRHGMKLSRAEIDQLTNPKKTGCLSVFSSVILRPLKELFREIFVWLEWKRGIDLATRAYYFGFLLDAIFEQGQYQSKFASQYVSVIYKSLDGTNTKLVRGIFTKTFQSSKGILKAVASWLFQFGKYYQKLAGNKFNKKVKQVMGNGRNKGTPSETIKNEAELDGLFNETRPKLNDLIPPMMESISKGIGALPIEHFEMLRNKLTQELDRMAPRKSG